MTSHVITESGGFLLALKNYDGDIFSEIVASGLCGQPLMFSRLVGLNGEVLSEANHGTIERHYKMWQQGEETSTNPIATIFAWTEALLRRA